MATTSATQSRSRASINDERSPAEQLRHNCERLARLMQNVRMFPRFVPSEDFKTLIQASQQALKEEQILLAKNKTYEAQQMLDGKFRAFVRNSGEHFGSKIDDAMKAWKDIPEIVAKYGELHQLQAELTSLIPKDQPNYSRISEIHSKIVEMLDAGEEEYEKRHDQMDVDQSKVLLDQIAKMIKR